MSNLWKRSGLIILFLGLFCLKPVFAQETRPVSGFIDFNAYYDTRDYSVLTYNILANLPHRIQYFSLTNFQGNEKNSDVAGFYAEHNLRYALGEQSPLDATVQYVTRSGSKNDNIRFGARLSFHKLKMFSSKMKKWKVSYSINPMFLEYGVSQIPKYATVIEHVYKILMLNNRMYIGGFADQNFVTINGSTKTFWVTEHQLGYRLIDQLYLVAEYRVNEFQNKNTGLGFGVEYKIKF